MAKKVRIYKKDGTPTPYFWSDKDQGVLKTVYKRTSKGVAKMKGVAFDAQKNRMRKQ